MKILNSTVLIALLVSMAMFANQASAEDLSKADFVFIRNLNIGSRGDDVTALQQFLITNGFLKISTPTGYFGPLTKSTLRAWQVSAGIFPSTGFFGPISRAKIFTMNHVAPITVPITPNKTETILTPSSSTIPSHDMSGLPIQIKIPKIQVDASIQYTGLSADNVMEIPNNVVDVGWFTGSPRPGEKGSAVVTGHVAQIRGGVQTRPGVFVDLHTLVLGDTLSVQNDKGEILNFIVRESRLFDPVADATEVFTPSDNGAHMNIITCEGTWNPDQLSYSKRLVVFTDLIQ